MNDYRYRIMPTLEPGKFYLQRRIMVTEGLLRKRKVEKWVTMNPYYHCPVEARYDHLSEDQCMVLLAQLKKGVIDL